MGKFDDKTVIVTGGNSGIGRAAAIQFAEEGANVAIMARNEQTGAEAVDAVKSLGVEAKFYKVDVSIQEQLEAAHDQVVMDFGQYHAAFNNSGISGPPNIFHELSDDDFDSVMKVNAYSVFWGMRAQIRHFLASGTAGSIVNCASVAGLLGRPYMASYSASKHAVVGITKAVALDYAAQGIRVNALCPGVTETPTLINYVDSLPEETQQQVWAGIPRGRMASGEELASTAIYLCTDLAANITGQAFTSDGGFSVV